MKVIYDYVFLTHLPAFYKVNLYQEIAKSCKIFVIFIAPSSTIRPPNFTASSFPFDHCILNEVDFENRSIFSSLFRLRTQLNLINYRKVVVGGWDLIEFWWMILFSPKRKNALALESSIFESKTNGLRGIIKRFFLSKISMAFCSGKPQASLLQAMKFEGEIKFTLGVGVFNYPLKKSSTSDKKFQSKFLYVGRLAPEKNIKMLIEAFSILPDCHLTIIGDGPLKAALTQLATSNVSFKGYIAKEELGAFYADHDVFILPSLKEPWGLVVEEALFYGLPVIVSEQVGCAYDLVKVNNVGILYNPLSNEGLYSAITDVTSHYALFQENVKNLNFVKRDQFQVRQYLDSLL